MSQPVTTESGAATAGAATTAAPTLPPHLLKAMSRVTEIGSLPEITTKIVQVVEDPKSTAQDMHELVKNDPALAAKILKVVNSAFYGLPSQIASLDRAIVMLGLSAVKNIALAASLARFFKPGAIAGQFEARDLWKHSVAVGVCARLLSKAAGQTHTDEAFVAGLVHDLGLLVEQQLFPDKLRETVERCLATPQNFCAAETEIIGADHQLFGATLATKWKFPPALRVAISHHHEPLALNSQLQRIGTLIYVADTICCQNEIGFWLTAKSQEVTAEMLALIGVREAALPAILNELPERIADAESIFNEG